MDENFVNVRLTVKEINVIVKQLSKMKYRDSAELISNIQRQAMSQVTAQSNAVDVKKNV